MGVGLNTMLAAVGASGVAASKVASSFGNISEANDASKNRAAAQRARQNVQQAKEDKQILKKTVHKAFTQNDPKANQELRDMGGR